VGLIVTPVTFAAALTEYRKAYRFRRSKPQRFRLAQDRMAGQVYACVRATLAKYFLEHVQDEDMVQDIVIHVFKILDRIDLDDQPLSFTITAIRNHAAQVRRTNYSYRDRIRRMAAQLLR
jgi:DNA-directed RNA polymerase specialized sigma24 family protein